MTSEEKAAVSRMRERYGFLSAGELVERCERVGSTCLDPCSVLVGRAASFGEGNVFFPGVVILCDESSSVQIGKNNRFFPATFLAAEHGGWIVVGDGNEFGDGGVSVKANRSSSRITIGCNGRYLNGVEVVGVCDLGSGSQVIGRITVQDCQLGAGVPHTGVDPDQRGAVLKGTGLARKIRLECGDVLEGWGSFEQGQKKRQSFFHPRDGK